MKNIVYFSFIFVVLLLSVCSFGSIFTKAESISFSSGNSGGARSASTNFILESSLGQPFSGLGSSSGYGLNSGYQQSDIGSYLTISVTYPSGSEVAMNSISGLGSGDIGNGSADIKVTTDYNGYDLKTRSSTSPALKCDTSSSCSASDAFDDYTPSGGVGVPDFNWSVGNSAVEFGFTPKGSDIAAQYKYDVGGSACGSGSTSSSGAYCWDGFSTSDATIASTLLPNYPNGSTTTLKFRSQVGTSGSVPAGTYKANIVVTAIANL